MSGKQTESVKPQWEPRYHEPQECAKYDPPMQVWLDLPVGLGTEETICPRCGSTHFGTMNPTGYFWVKICHDEHVQGCRQQYRSSASIRMVAEIAEALSGRGKTF